MIKVVTALPRRADLTREQFQHHWGTVHRELALRIDRISRYVQSHALAAPPSALPVVRYDGFPEVWFRDLDTALGLGDDPQYAQGAHLDEPAFIDLAGMTRSWVRPQLHRPWAGFADFGAPGKALLLVPGPPTDARADALLAAVEGLRPRRVLLGTALDDPRVLDRQGFGHVVELWWSDVGAARQAWVAGEPSLLAGLREVADPTTCSFALVAERRVRWPGAVLDGDESA